VLMVLLLGVRPLIKALRRDPAQPAIAADGDTEAGDGPDGADGAAAASGAAALPAGPVGAAVDTALLSQQVGLAQRLVQEKPHSAVAALREMLNDQPEPEVSQ
jgi:flagellar M-ring protein FliF